MVFYIKKGVNFRLVIYTMIPSVIAFLAAVFINYVYSKIGSYIVKQAKIIISRDCIEYKLFLIRKRVFFKSIKKIQILNEFNLPKVFKIMFEAAEIQGIRIEYQPGLLDRGRMFLYNIDNLDKFLEELKAKIPYHIIQRAFVK